MAQQQLDHRRNHEESGAHSLLVVLLALLTVGLIWLGIVSILGTNQPFEATVGRSMLPTLRTGDLVVLRGVAPRDIRRGDIVAVHPSEEDRAKYRYPSTVMHRVERVTFDQRTVMVYTRGDNESASDPFSVPASAVEGRLAYRIPKAGWVLLYLRSKQGLIAVGGLLVLYLVYAGTKWISDADDEQQDAEIASPAGFSELASAIAEYGEHLRSHTRVVQELGGTTAELHLAATTQNEVLDNLKQALISAWTPLMVAPAPSAPVAPVAPRSVTIDPPERTPRSVDAALSSPMWPDGPLDDLAAVLHRVVIRGARQGLAVADAATSIAPTPPIATPLLKRGAASPVRTNIGRGDMAMVGAIEAGVASLTLIGSRGR